MRYLTKELQSTNRNEHMSRLRMLRKYLRFQTLHEMPLVKFVLHFVDYFLWRDFWFLGCDSVKKRRFLNISDSTFEMSYSSSKMFDENFVHFWKRRTLKSFFFNLGKCKFMHTWRQPNSTADFVTLSKFLYLSCDSDGLTHESESNWVNSDSGFSEI